MQKLDIGLSSFELEFLLKISSKLNLMESQGYFFHVLKGKFPFLSIKARDGEHYFFSTIYTSGAAVLSKLHMLFIPLG